MKSAWPIKFIDLYTSGNIHELQISKTIRKVKDKIAAQERYVSVEQANLITDYYHQTHDEPVNLKRANSLKYVARRISIQIDPEELIIGNRSFGVRDGIVFPETAVAWIMKESETLEVRRQDPFHFRKEDKELFKNKIFHSWNGKTLEDTIKKRLGSDLDEFQKVVKLNQKDHAQGHIIPDVRTWLVKGPSQIKQEIQQIQPTETDVSIFFQSAIIALEAFQLYLNRYRKLAISMTDNHKNEIHKDRLKSIAEITDKIAYSVPETFHEALQSVWFLFVFLHLESNASSFSFGRLDQILYPYLEKDLEKGTISLSTAFELICAFYLKCNEIVYFRNSHSAKYFAGFPIGFNLCIGGKDEYGRDCTNLLSHLFLKAQEVIGFPQPNLSARLHENSPLSFISHCSRVISKGSGMPQIFNDESIIQALKDRGVEEHDAYDYAIVGCVELSTQGNYLGWSDAAMINLVKVLELTMNNGRCRLSGKQLGIPTGEFHQFKDYNEFEKAFEKQLDYFIEKTIEKTRIIDRTHQEMLPSPFLSTVVNNCLDKGKDVTAGGAFYNFSGIQGIQIANLADSMYAIKKCVFEDKIIDSAELQELLDNNFQGNEKMRLFLVNKLPKYGNDRDEVDDLGVKWANKFAGKINSFKSERNGKCHTGFYTVSAHVPMGQNVGATPDGRKAEAPLADGGLSAMAGKDRLGPTALLKSVSKIDFSLASNGTLLNMKFVPSLFTHDRGMRAFNDLLRAFVKLKIHHVQFNVVNRDDLIRARANPEEYSNLTVRVAGYTAYFVDLAEDLKDEIIERTTFGE